jgi:hypothetical protein
MHCHIVSRLFTRLTAPPIFRFRSYARLTAVQPLQGFVLAIIPTLLLTAVLEIVFNQIDLLRWQKPTFGAFQTNMFQAADTVQMDVVMHGRFGLGLAVVAIYTMFLGAHMMTPKKDRIEIDEVTTGSDESIESRTWQPGEDLFTSTSVHDCFTCKMCFGSRDHTFWGLARFSLCLYG